jgi:hypothetical protein
MIYPLMQPRLYKQKFTARLVVLRQFSSFKSGLKFPRGWPFWRDHDPPENRIDHQATSNI